jgi:hypothetical protein
MVRNLAASTVGALFAAHPMPSQAAVVTPAAQSSCPSGNFCVWSGTNFTGQIQKISTSNSYKAISLSSVNSHYNNRTKRTWLHEDLDGGGSTTCIKPGVAKLSTSGWQTTADAAYLATITTC